MPNACTKKEESPCQPLKVETAQHQKQFISDVKYIIEKTCGTDVLRYIPQEDFEQLYTFRFRPVSIRAAAGEDIPADTLRFANRMISQLSLKMYTRSPAGCLTYTFSHMPLTAWLNAWMELSRVFYTLAYIVH
jgi:hypothetical protein